MEQGSYMLIERGMTVRGTDGDLGTVSDIVADESVDVFRGIILSEGLLLPRRKFVAAGYVSRVEQNVVYVTLTKQEANVLPSEAEASTS